MNAVQIEQKSYEMPPKEGIKALMARGFHKPGDIENRLGYYLGRIAR